MSQEDNNRPRPKVLITGASGLLGRSINNKFKAEGWNVYGVALSRVQNNLHKLDITKKDDVVKTIRGFNPDIIIHSAAQRFPDKVESDPEAAKLINVYATGFIAEVAAEVGAPVLYISTDYVFDGNAGKPYTINDNPNPINLYGKTKLEGEVVTLKNADNLVLRVPVLYGPVLALKESAVTCLLEPLLLKDKLANISDLERRCPSHVDDIALICYQMANARVLKKDKRVCGIFQWCGKEKMTKYQMVLKMAEVFKLPHSHLKPESKANSSATRPLDTEMDQSRLARFGFGRHTPFQEGVEEVLSSWVSYNCDLLNVRPYTVPTVK